MRNTIALISLLAVAAPVHGARAQTTLPAHPVWTGISAKAQQQIDDVHAAMQKYAAQDKARSAGFIPVLGWIPTMGTHWVDNPRMLRDGKKFDMNAPVQLMYSPVNGKETLVGAAYAYLTPVADTVRPSSFDGNPPWHEHPDLAPAGMRLVMLHVWFVPSPDGPFAGHNPNLPYWAAGVTPPDASMLKADGEDTRVRKTGMALAVVADTAGLFPLLHQRPAVRAVEDARADSIRALMPELDAAAKAHDTARWNRAADRADAQFDTLRTMWVDAAIRPDSKARINRFLDDELGDMHGMNMHH